MCAEPVRSRARGVNSCTAALCATTCRAVCCSQRPRGPSRRPASGGRDMHATMPPGCRCAAPWAPFFLPLIPHSHVRKRAPRSTKTQGTPHTQSPPPRRQRPLHPCGRPTPRSLPFWGGGGSPPDLPRGYRHKWLCFRSWQCRRPWRRLPSTALPTCPRPLPWPWTPPKGSAACA